MKTGKLLSIVLAGMALAAQSFGAVGDEFNINFRENTQANFVPTNPPGFRDIPMVSLGGKSHYFQPWEVMTASIGPNVGLNTNSGTGTVTFDQIPSFPEGEYHVYINFNIANWDGPPAISPAAPIGFQLGGIGVTELGNQMPGAMHFFYPQSNTGQDTVNFVELAGPNMGTGSTNLAYRGGLFPVTLNFPVGSGECSPNCPPIPTETTNAFASSIILAPGNQFVLSIHDGADQDLPPGGTAHIRVYSMIFTNVAPYAPPPDEACCFADGSCQDMDPNVCMVSNGIPQGVSTTCAGTSCPQTQACCFFPSGACSDLLTSICTSQGGTSQGGGTTCATTSCRQPVSDFTEVTINDAGAICFVSEVGTTYELQYTTNLITTPGWVNAGIRLKASETNSYFFDPEEPTGSTTNKRYRVVLPTN